jgi:Cof subfamily protein (haloacid dehalogenase superfamily)
MPYQLLVLDVDGTVLDSHHQLRPRVAAAIRGAQDAGLPVTLATGKMLRSVALLITELELRGPQITLNGAALVDANSGKPLRFHPLREDDRRDIIQAVRRVDPTVLVTHFALDGIYVAEEHPLLSILVAYGEPASNRVPTLLADDLPPAGKILLSGKPEQLAALRIALTPELGERVTITTTTPDFLEFFDPLAGKGLALAALRDELGIPRESIIAIGDGENDIPLFREAGLAVAMGNAGTATKAAAQRIIPSNDEEGVATFLEELLGIQVPAQ